MTQVLLSPDNEFGYKLEELIVLIREDLKLQTAVLEKDASTASAVICTGNNLIIGHLIHIEKIFSFFTVHSNIFMVFSPIIVCIFSIRRQGLLRLNQNGKL